MAELAQRFRTKDKPSQNDYQDLIDTFQNWAETAQIEGFTTPLGSLHPNNFADGPANQVLTTDGSGVPDWRDGPPASGTAGGDLQGTFPNPIVKANSQSTANLLISQAAAIGPGAVLSYDGSSIAWRIIAPPVITIQDVRASGVNGGTFTQGAWIIRTLTTLQQSVPDLATLSGNQFTLTKGTWYCRLSCPASGVQRHQARLWNVTDNVMQLPGTSQDSAASDSTSPASFVTGLFTITGSKTFRVEHRCSNSNGNTGFGVASNFGINEIYTEGEFRKLA